MQRGTEINGPVSVSPDGDAAPWRPNFPETSARGLYCGHLHGKDREPNTEKVSGGAFAKGAGMFFAGLSCILTPHKSQE